MDCRSTPRMRSGTRTGGAPWPISTRRGRRSNRRVSADRPQGRRRGAGLASVPAVSSPPAAAAPLPAASLPQAPATQGAAAPPASRRAGGTVKLGDYHSDAGREGGHDRDQHGLHGQDRHRRPHQHRQAQRLPGQHHAATCGGTPDDDFTWFSGYRMQFFAAQGLATPIDDVWRQGRCQLHGRLQGGLDRRRRQDLLVPIDNYPWAVFYRKSLFADKGYKVPTTWDELMTLCAKMKTDGLIPFAFARQGRLAGHGHLRHPQPAPNGYQFHVDLMAGKEKWTDSKVTAVFNKWKELLPVPPAMPRLTWQVGRRGRVADPARRPACTSWACSWPTSSRIRPTWPTSTSSLPDVRQPVRRREGARRTDRRHHDQLEVADTPGQPACRQGVSRVLGQGRTQDLLLRQGARASSRGQRCRHEQVHRAPEEGRPDRRRRPEDRPVPRPGHPAGLRRRERHAEFLLRTSSGIRTRISRPFSGRSRSYWDSLPPTE